MQQGKMYKNPFCLSIPWPYKAIYLCAIKTN